MQSSNENEQIQVLIAEDNLVNTRIINKLITRLLPSALITLVKNGQEAVDEFKKPNTNFSLIIIDGEMPVMKGWDAVNEIRRWHSTEEGKNKKRPIIISWSTEPRALVYDTDGKTVIGIQAFDGADDPLYKGENGTKLADLAKLLIKFNFISSLEATPKNETPSQTVATTPAASSISQFSSPLKKQRKAGIDTEIEPTPEVTSSLSQIKPKSK